MKEISDELYQELEYLGIIDKSGVRNHNVGKSNYHTKLISPWVVWRAYPELSSFDHDIIKRVLREKEGDTRKMDYEKIIHVCQECIRGIDVKEKNDKIYEPIFDKEDTEIKKGDVFLCIKDWCIDEGDRMYVLFTENFYYQSQCDGHITGNHGNTIKVNKTELNKYFKRNKD